MVVHSVTRGWQDIRILLGVMGARQPPIPCPTEGCLVTSCTLSYCHFAKTYCRKDPPPGGDCEEQMAACIPAQPIAPTHIGQARQPSGSATLRIAGGDPGAIEGFLGTVPGGRESDAMQKKRHE